MERKRWVGLCLIAVMVMWIGAPASSFADEAQYYIDRFAQQVAQNVASGKINENVTPEANSTGGFNFVRFFAGAFGPNEFSDPNWFIDPVEMTGSHIFGDSVQNPTGFRADGTYVSGPDIDRASGTRTVNDATLRDQVNAFRENPSDANRSNIETSLRSLGYDGSFIIE